MAPPKPPRVPISQVKPPAAPNVMPDVAQLGLETYLAPPASPKVSVSAPPMPGTDTLQYLLSSNAKLAGIPGLTLPTPPALAATSSPSSAGGGPSTSQGGPARAAGAGGGGMYGPTPASNARAPIGGYPAGMIGKIIGTPYSGTHTLGNWESDNAVDIALPYGTPIIAIMDGTIGSQFGSLGSGNPRFAGLRLHLQSKGQEAYYAHLSKFAPGIKPGVHVKRGQVIGYSGAANGVNHLHFAVLHGDPRTYARH